MRTQSTQNFLNINKQTKMRTFEVNLVLNHLLGANGVFIWS